MPSRHLSLRINHDTLDRLDARARRERRTRSDVAKQLIEEGLRMQAHPGIIFVDGAVGRRPTLVHGPDVWEVARLFQNIGWDDDEKLALVGEWATLRPEQVRAALDYYLAYQSEIDEWIRLNDEEAERAYADWRRAQEALAS